MNINTQIRFCAVLILIQIVTCSFAQPVGQTGFESFADEAVFTQSSWTSEGFTVPWVNGFDQSRAYVDDAYSHDGTKSLRIFFPQGQYSPSNSGAQAPLMVTPASQYYISYWLRFSDDFSWGNTSEGGKLPGLAGGGRCSGCSTCDGTNGFTARLMWRTGGKAVLYLYDMDKTDPCGDNFNLQLSAGVDFAFQKGLWYNVIERVKVNTGNNYDGEVELWINQQPALLKTGIRFVNNGDQVDDLYFSTFHGGSTSGWAPTVDSYIWFDDFVISTNSADVFTTLGIKDNLPFASSAKQESLIKISPLPLERNNSFTLSGQNAANPIIKFQWINMVGVVRKEEDFTGMQNDYITPDLEPGMYLLKIYLNDQVFSNKVLVR